MYFAFMMLDSQSKFNVARNSSTELARLSVSPFRAELFLERLANLDMSSLMTDDRKARNFAVRFAELVSVDDPIQLQLQPQLRGAWKESVPGWKEAGLMMMAGGYMQMSAQSVAFTGVPDKFLMVLLYALKHVHLLRYCANPDCKEPYFVARRASQVFCSGPCAKPAQREAKRKWWNEHGEAARRKRLQKKRRGKYAKAKKT